MTSILASRFLVNLRRAARASTSTVDTQSPSYVRDELDSGLPTVMSSVEFTPRSADFEVGRVDEDTDVSVYLRDDVELMPTDVLVVGGG